MHRGGHLEASRLVERISSSRGYSSPDLTLVFRTNMPTLVANRRPQVRATACFGTPAPTGTRAAPPLPVTLGARFSRFLCEVTA